MSPSLSKAAFTVALIVMATAGGGTAYATRHLMTDEFLIAMVFALCAAAAALCFVILGAAAGEALRELYRAARRSRGQE